MAANVLNSPVAVQASVQVVRAFVRLREMVISNLELARRLDELEKRYDGQFKVVFDALRQLMSPPPAPRIGFRVTKGGAKDETKNHAPRRKPRKLAGATIRANRHANTLAERTVSLCTPKDNPRRKRRPC